MVEHPLFIPIDSKIRSLRYMTVGDAPTEEILHEFCVAARQFATIYIMNVNPWSTAASKALNRRPTIVAEGGLECQFHEAEEILQRPTLDRLVGVAGHGNAQGKKKDGAINLVG